MYDAIVVGARCAGSPTAMLLARRGLRVLVVDRAGFPSDTLSTHYIHQPGVERLRRWGLLDRVVASGCPPARRLTFDVGPFALSAAPPPAGGSDAAYAPRRRLLDQVLVDAAAEAGAEVRERFSMSEVLVEDGHVTGIRGRAPGGATVTERARIVVGADGVHSRVAKAVGAPAYDARPGRTCAYYTYWDGLPLDGAELYPRPGRMVIAGPTNDGRAVVTSFWPRAEFHRVRADVDGAFLDAVALAPSLAERMRAGSRAEPFRGSGDLPFFFRRPYGPGWALVGDAGCHKDPLTAQGITDAFRDAELLAEAIADGLGGRRPLGDALAGYGSRRDEAARPMYEFTHELAALAPPSPEMQALFGALRDDPQATSRFFGTIAGTVPMTEFPAPREAAAVS